MHPSWKVLPCWIFYHLIQTEMNGIKSDKLKSEKRNGAFCSLSLSLSLVHAMNAKTWLELWIYRRKKRSTNNTMLATDPVCCVFLSSRPWRIHFKWASLCFCNSLPLCRKYSYSKIYLNTRSTLSSFMKVSKAQNIVFEKGEREICEIITTQCVHQRYEFYLFIQFY